MIELFKHQMWNICGSGAAAAMRPGDEASVWASGEGGLFLLFLLKKPPDKKRVYLEKCPKYGWVGCGVPKLLVKFINHCCYGIFDHYIWLKVQKCSAILRQESQIYEI